jgi:glycosyltransferase involved in cell wall biosynthesis
MPRVSVIIPAYHHAALIGKAIDSVLAQTYRDFEIVVVNDGSPDDTEEVLRPYIESGKIHYIRQENQGAAAARNRGVEMAEGELLAFLDDDDRWPSDKLEWQVAAIEATDTVVVGGVNDGERCICLNESSGVDTYQTLPTYSFFTRNPFGSPGQTLIRRTAFDAVNGFDPDIWGVDDLDIWIRLSRMGDVRKYSKLSLFYRLHDSNASHNYNRMAINLKKVISKNCDIEGFENIKKLDRLGHRYLFNYSGKKMIWRAGACLFSGEFQKAISNFRGAFKYYEDRFLKDPKLFGMLVMALIKIPMRARRYL